MHWNLQLELYSCIEQLESLAMEPNGSHSECVHLTADSSEYNRHLRIGSVQLVRLCTNN